MNNPQVPTGPGPWRASLMGPLVGIADLLFNLGSEDLAMQYDNRVLLPLFGP